jgi:hypothetical protein
MAVRYVTKYGLTQGILKVDGRLSNNGEMFNYSLPGYWPSQYAHGAGRDFHETLEDAQARVAAMASKRVASAKKTIARLEAYVPKVVEV